MFSLLSFCVYKFYSVKTARAEQVLLLLYFTPITNFKYRMQKHAALFINIYPFLNQGLLNLLGVTAVLNHRSLK